MNWDWEKLKEQQQQRSGGPVPPPPQVDELLEKVKKLKLPGGPIVIIILLLLFIASSMVYTIDKDEVGVVQRFGKHVRTTYPGLNIKFPMGIEKVTPVNVEKVRTEEFGFRSARGSNEGRFATSSEDTHVSLMLTGDLNVALVPWIVQYRVRVDEAHLFLFKVNDVQQLLTDMSEASMRLVVGDRSINEVISKRDEIAQEATATLQRELDQAETGIHVITIELKKTNVPPSVQPSFNEVNQATQEKEQMIYQAEEDYNKAIPAARGEAQRTIQAAEGYALDRINRAKGDASRFNALYGEYRKARDVTKRRLYLEKMRELLPKTGKKYIVDADQKSILPLLNLDNPNGIQK